MSHDQSVSENMSFGYININTITIGNKAYVVLQIATDKPQINVSKLIYHYVCSNKYSHNLSMRKAALQTLNQTMER